MKEETQMERYSVITEKNPREIVLLRGSGCVWRRCTFCDYHLDFDQNEEENYALNCRELSKVTGMYHHLEIINSGSFFELDEQTFEKIIQICKEKDIHRLHFESHWLFRERIPSMRERFQKEGIELKIKIGVESFDKDFRENVLKKGIDTDKVSDIAKYFDEVCLLQGLSGQTAESMQQDIEIGLSNFERVCVNIMVENTTKIKPDYVVIHEFKKRVYPIYKDNERVDILLNNVDFGVGARKE